MRLSQNNFIRCPAGKNMSDTVLSPDGKYLWTGSEWIPAPPSNNQNLNMQDSVIAGDVIHSKTVINNDVDAVTGAVISALERLGMVNKYETSSKIEEVIETEISQTDDATISLGDRVLVDWKNYGTFFPGKIAGIEGDGNYLIHFDDGDVESSVPATRIAIQPDSEATKQYVDQICEEEQELIDSFAVFDVDNTGTIHARKLFQILTEMGDALDISEAEELFAEMGISLDSELNYKDLAKIMVQPFEPKPEVIIDDAAIEDQVLVGFAYGHPKLGDTSIRSTEIIKTTYDNRATARVETRNTIYVVGPTGWRQRPANHPFNEPEFISGQQVKVEWGGQWWDGLIKEIANDRYHVHYMGFDASWDEWVDAPRIKKH